MSRSHKKISIHGILSAESEKKDKRLGNRAIRRRNKEILNSFTDPLFLFYNKSKCYNVYKMAKDGKCYFILLKENEINNNWNYLDLLTFLKLLRK